MKLGIPVEGTTYIVGLNVRSGVSRYRMSGEHITLTEYGIVLGKRNAEKYSDHSGEWKKVEQDGMVFHPWHMVERIQEVTSGVKRRAN